MAPNWQAYLDRAMEEISTALQTPLNLRAIAPRASVLAAAVAGLGLTELRAVLADRPDARDLPAQRQHVGVVPEYVLGAISVMDVGIHDRYAADAIALAQIGDHDRLVVNVAESPVAVVVQG